MDYKTPGVFVEEIALFPPSVAQVATAVPAFVGHTARTTDATGASLINRPVRLQSLLEYRALFGGEYTPASYAVNLGPAPAFDILAVNPVGNRRYYLYNCLRHFFDNGGGPCYIVSVGDYNTAVAYGSDTTGLRGGLKSLEKVDEPTLLVAPDAAALRQVDGAPDFAQTGNLHQDIIAQCTALQDRFGVLDLNEGYLAPDAASTPVQQFRNRVGTDNLKYAAAYYPWLYSVYFQELHFGQLAFFDNAVPANPIPNGTIDAMTGNAAIDALVVQLRNRIAEEQNIFSKIAAVSLNRSNFRPLSGHFTSLQNTVLAASTAVAARAAFSALMNFVRQLALSLRDLENDAGIPAELQAQLSQLEADATLRVQLANLIAFEKNTGVLNSISATRTVGNVQTDYAILDNEDWIGGVTVASIAANATDFTNGGGNSVAQPAQAAARSSMLLTAFNRIAEAFSAVADSGVFQTDQAEKQVFTLHPFFKSLYERIRRDSSLLPPSGAVAGVYANTDRTRGVWKAPANVSLRAVVGPAVKLTDSDQSTLNVHDTGKSVNAIRAFTGKGTLVWGARTLAGNDNEWRYVNVRRFFNMVEESTKKASEPFVFEPNDANTWIRVRAMIENFLTLQWRQGALAGATPQQAFYVKVGLGETMTAQDILEGRMIVEIGMAAVRPAEFIILRFSHKMQEA